MLPIQSCDACSILRPAGDLLLSDANSLPPSPPATKSFVQSPTAEMRTAIDVQDVTRDRLGIGQVHDGIRDVLDPRLRGAV